MTRDETLTAEEVEGKNKLKQEAEEWLNKWELCNKCKNKVYCISNFSYCKKVVLQSYLASAEPREKRIAELEERVQKQSDELYNRYAETKFYKENWENVKKENAELKNRNQELLESCEGATMMYKDLQKATGIIKKYLTIGVGGKITQNYLDVTKEAEQFLKDECCPDVMCEDCKKECELSEVEK